MLTKMNRLRNGILLLQDYFCEVFLIFSQPVIDEKHLLGTAQENILKMTTYFTFNVVE